MFIPILTMKISAPTRVAAIVLGSIAHHHNTCKAFQLGILSVHRVSSLPNNNHRHNYSPLISPHQFHRHPSKLFLSSSSSSSSSYPADVDNGETNDITDHTTPSSITAESILNDFHQSNYIFRIIVIGNGAILETTSPLGPISKSSISPKSGEKLVTFASNDQSFEFHVKVEQICKIVFVANGGADQTKKVARFLSEIGTPICSLILCETDDEEEAARIWFDELVNKYGNEVIL